MDILIICFETPSVSAIIEQWTGFQNLTPTLPTMQFSHQVITVSLLDYMHLPLEPQKLLYYFFFTYAVVLPKSKLLVTEIWAQVVMTWIRIDLTNGFDDLQVATGLDRK